VFRVAAGLTQAELAERAGIAAITVTRIENRQHEPFTATVVKLAAALGVEPGALIPANDERPAATPGARTPQGGADRGAG